MAHSCYCYGSFPTSIASFSGITSYIDASKGNDYDNSNKSSSSSSSRGKRQQRKGEEEVIEIKKGKVGLTRSDGKRGKRERRRNVVGLHSAQHVLSTTLIIVSVFTTSVAYLCDFYFLDPFSQA